MNKAMFCLDLLGFIYITIYISLLTGIGTWILRQLCVVQVVAVSAVHWRLLRLHGWLLQVLQVRRDAHRACRELGKA